MSSRHASDARSAILNFFNADPSVYSVVFTSNASAALKLVGESFPFFEGGLQLGRTQPKSRFILPIDSHNSVNGLREYALKASAEVHYISMDEEHSPSLFIPSSSTRPFSSTDSQAENYLSPNGPVSPSSPSLFALTGQSNLTGRKHPLSILKRAKSLGYYTLLDAAALAPTSRLSLADSFVDVMVISLYKMVGYPTGVGALVARKDFLKVLRKQWFSGGSVSLVQVRWL